MDDDRVLCTFCAIVRGEKPSEVIWRDARHLAFLSLYPNTEGVTIVIPTKHYSSYAFGDELSDVVYSELCLAARTVGRLLDAAFNDVGRTAMVYEGFGINHLHAKLFPLHGTPKVWERLSCPKHDYYDSYPGYVSSHSGSKADAVMLAATAEKIRRAGRR